MTTVGHNSCIADKYLTTEVSTTRKIVIRESSEDLDSPEYSYDSNDLRTPGAEENSSKHISFTELLLTPEKTTLVMEPTLVMKPAVNSCSVILAKELFVNKKDLKNTDNTCIS